MAARRQFGRMTTQDTLQTALYTIPAEDRETWVQVGMALHAEFGDAGFDLWESWSKQSERYKTR